jgi:hypothetical protein
LLLCRYSATLSQAIKQKRWESNMVHADQARLLVRAAAAIHGPEADSLRVALLRWADELLDQQGLELTPRKSQSFAGPNGKSIFANYKHERYDARLLQRWRVHYDGVTYPTPSAAAVAITGNPTNGWRFWRYTDPDSGGIEPIDRLRSKGPKARVGDVGE